MTQHERQQEILAALYQRRYDTMSNLAQEFGVCRQTIYRDIAALSIVHPEIIVKSGRYGGGISIEKGCYAKKKILTRKEQELLQKLQRSLNGEDYEIMRGLLHRLVG